MTVVNDRRRKHRQLMATENLDGCVLEVCGILMPPSLCNANIPHRLVRYLPAWLIFHKDISLDGSDRKMRERTLTHSVP